MSRFRPESYGFLLLVLSFCVFSPFSPSPAYAGTPPLHPIYEAHEGHDDGAGGTTGPVVIPPAQGPTACVDGFAGAYPCRNVDLLSFLPLDQMGAGTSRGSDIWGWTDAKTGREYALMVLTDRAVFVDVSDPTRPRWLGSMMSETHRSSSNRDVRVYRDHAYIVADSVGAHGMQVFDLTRLRSVTTPQTFQADSVYHEVETVHNIDIDTATGYAYLVGSNTCAGGLHMVDLRDPANPRPAGCYYNAADGSVPYIHDTQCVIYRGPDKRFDKHEICFASNVNALAIIDVTDKSAPREIARRTYEGVGYCHQGWLTEDQRYFLMDDEGDELVHQHNTRTYLWDLSDLTDPRQFATYDNPSTRAIDHDQYVLGNFSYQGNYRSGLRILDISRVAEGTLNEVAFFDVFPADDSPSYGGAWGAYPYLKSGIILVPGMEEGLYILRRSDQVKPTGPCKAGAQTLCLSRKRFRLEVDWTNLFDGTSGRGRVTKGTGDKAGYFSFGDPSNLELMVKILDDGSHWRLYYGQLTNLAFTIRVIDTETGQMKSFGNGQGNCGGVAELWPSDGHSHDELWLGADPTRLAEPGDGIAEGADLTPVFEAAKGKGACAKSGDAVCLLGNRYRARVTWTNQFNGSSGTAKGRALSGVTGSFAFSDPANVDLLVKVLSAEGDRTLVIWGAMTNLEYTLELTDTKTGEVRTFHNPPGTYCGGMSEL